jgi:hypothetical protein
MGMLSAEQVRQILIPPTVTVEDAGRVLRLSRNSAYEAVRRGDLQSIRMGRRLLVVTAPLRKMLQIESA